MNTWDIVEEAWKKAALDKCAFHLLENKKERSIRCWAIFKFFFFFFCHLLRRRSKELRYQVGRRPYLCDRWNEIWAGAINLISRRVKTTAPWIARRSRCSSIDSGASRRKRNWPFCNIPLPTNFVLIHLKTGTELEHKPEVHIWRSCFIKIGGRGSK